MDISSISKTVEKQDGWPSVGFDVAHFICNLPQKWCTTLKKFDYEMEWISRTLKAVFQVVKKCNLDLWSHLGYCRTLAEERERQISTCDYQQLSFLIWKLGYKPLCNNATRTIFSCLYCAIFELKMYWKKSISSSHLQMHLLTKTNGYFVKIQWVGCSSMILGKFEVFEANWLEFPKFYWQMDDSYFPKDNDRTLLLKMMWKENGW